MTFAHAAVAKSIKSAAELTHSNIRRLHKVINIDSGQEINRYKTLMSLPDVMVFFFDEDGHISERSTFVSKQLDYAEDDNLYMQEIFRSVTKLNNGKITLTGKSEKEHFETVAYRKNQTCITVDVYIVFLNEEDTGCYGMCFAQNIAKQKEKTKELRYAKVEVEEAHKERNELVANVTHELRTPVNGVLGLATNLLDTGLSTEQRESVDIIRQCCNNMIKIINNILDYSKLQAGKFTIENEEFSFHRMMDNLVKVNTPQVDEKGIKLICNVSADIPDMIIGDELRLTQVLNNLMSNAIKFTSVGQIVVNVIKTVEIDDELELFFMVIDSGIGIAQSEMDKLFKSFSQVDASITRRFGGTGLGLNIVKDLVEMMGGNVNVESEKGKGSTFSFSIKVKKADSENTDVVEENTYSFNLGNVSEDDDEDLQSSEIYKLGSAENIKEINANMEKLVICIEMENWERANAFAENIKQLVADDAMNLKRKAFRLQMTVRRGVHEDALEQYNELKEALNETLQLSRE